MTLSATVAHTFTSSIADDAAATAAGEVTPIRWNGTGAHTVALTGTLSPAQLDLTATYAWTGPHTYALGTITTSNPISISETWNAAGVTFSALTINPTPTAFAATSRWFDLQDNGVSLIRTELVSSGGGAADYGRLAITRARNNTTQNVFLDASGGSLNFSADFNMGVVFKNASTNKMTFDTAAASTGMTLASDMPLGWSSTTGAAYANEVALIRSSSTAIEVNNGTTGTFRDLKVRDVIVDDTAALVKTSQAMTNGAAASLGTLTNAPAAGNPTKWIPINDNGTTRYIPCW